MRKALLLLVLCALVFQAYSQTAPAADSVKGPWKLSGATSLNFVQASYSNWAAGGKNSVAGTAAGSLLAVYAKNNVSWENALALAYGLTYQGSDRSKNDDKIDFASKLGFKASEHWNYTILGSFKTQFDKGYQTYPIQEGAKYNSRFMAPAYAMLSLGMDYKPCSNFSLMMSPFAGKLTLVLDDTLSHYGAFGVAPDERIYCEFGAYVKATYTKKLHENIALITSVDLFSNLLKNPGNIDVNWELALNMKITKFISTKLGLQLIYDDDTKTINDSGAQSGPKVQFKEVLGVGFSYIF